MRFRITASNSSGYTSTYLSVDAAVSGKAVTYISTTVRDDSELDLLAVLYEVLQKSSEEQIDSAKSDIFKRLNSITDIE